MRCSFAVLLPVLLLASTPAAVVPPPPEQTAANCDSPTYASDMQVCGDSSLRALDARLRDAWTALDFAAVVASGAWVEEQQDWFKRRSLCAFSERHADCLQAAYSERIAVLDMLRLAASRSPRPGTATVCRNAPWGEGAVRLRAAATGALTIEDGDARVLAAATPLRPGEAWTPYVGFSVDRASVRLVPMNGPIVDCSGDDPR